MTHAQRTVILFTAVVFITLIVAALVSSLWPPQVAQQTPVHEAVTYPSLFGVTIRGEAWQPGIIEKIQAAGITWVRMSVDWAQIEPVQGLRQLDHLDAYFLPYLAAGLKPVVFVANNPAWAATSICGPLDIAGPQAMADLVAEMAERWPEIEYWQLYNEPDNRWLIGVASSFGGCYGDYPAEYAELMRVTRAALVKANPAAKLVFGVAQENVICPEDWECKGQPLFNTSFASLVLAACGIDSCFDVVDFHVYPDFHASWDLWGPGITGKTRWMRALLEMYGRYDVPLMVSETGVRSDIVGDEEQSAYLVRTYAQAMSEGLICVMWFSLADIPAP